MDELLHDFPFAGARLSPIAWFPFDESDIRRCLPGEIDKGRPYQRRGAVRDLRADQGGQRLIASVQGTRLRPYRVFVDIGKGNPVSLSARCSCPVAWNCKHGAAVLLEALQNPPAIEGTESDPLVGPVGGWLHQLRQAARPTAAPDELGYRLDHPARPGLPFVLDLRVVRVLKSGGWGADRPLPAGQLQNATAKYLGPADRAVLQLLRDGLGRSPPPLPEDPDLVDLLLHRIIATGRCRWQNLASPPLTLGPPRHGRLAWQLGPDGRQTIEVELNDGPAVPLPCASPWYVDPEEYLAGPVALDIARPLIGIALSAPPVTIAQATALGGLIERDLPDLVLPRPRADLVEEIRDDPPVPTSGARQSPAPPELLGGVGEGLGRAGRCRTARLRLWWHPDRCRRPAARAAQGRGRSHRGSPPRPRRRAVSAGPARIVRAARHRDLRRGCRGCRPNFLRLYGWPRQLAGLCL